MHVITSYRECLKAWIDMLSVIDNKYSKIQITINHTVNVGNKIKFKFNA